MFCHETDPAKKSHIGHIEWAHRIKRDSFFFAFPSTYFRLVNQMSQEQSRMGYLYPPGPGAEYHLRTGMVDVLPPFRPFCFCRSSGET